MQAEELLKRFEIVKKYTEGKRDFTGINLNEANLSRINLSQSILKKASLFVTNISGANLSECDFTEANLNVARLNSTNLTRSILNGASMNVANLVQANLTEAQLIGASLIRSELIRAELTRANFSAANLTQADLREVQLTGANLSRANLRSANLRGASASLANFEEANLHGADLTKADLKKVNFSNADLTQASLHQVDLSGADLSGANLKWADLSGANLNGADLSDAKLSGANLNLADLSNTNLANASLVHADLTETNLIHTDWVGADLTGATLTGAKICLIPRFGVIVDEITCDWVDLSPRGDRTQIQKFNSPSESRKFLNRSPALVQIVVDAVLDQSANNVLAKAYYEIAQYYPTMSCPPNLEIDYRRTIITFRFDSDKHLLPAAFLAVLPFDDSIEIHKNIVEIGKNILNQDMEKKLILQFCKGLNAAINNIKEVKELVLAKKADHETKFFDSPTKTMLISSGQQSLTVYHNPNFGKRGQNNPRSKFSLSVGQQLVDFLTSFDYAE